MLSEEQLRREEFENFPKETEISRTRSIAWVVVVCSLNIHACKFEKFDLPGSRFMNIRRGIVEIFREIIIEIYRGIFNCKMQRSTISNVFMLCFKFVIDMFNKNEKKVIFNFT